MPCSQYWPDANQISNCNLNLRTCEHSASTRPYIHHGFGSRKPDWQGRVHYKWAPAGRLSSMDSTKSTVAPKPLLSVADGVFLMAGMVIGAGIFKAPSI